MPVERPPQGGQWHPNPPKPPPKPQVLNLPGQQNIPQPGGTPATSGAGAAPLVAAGGAAVNKSTWALALIRALGGIPTQGIVNLIVSWINAEGTSAAWNPLAITGHDPGNAGTFNSAGVQNFSSFQAGLQATADFIRHASYMQTVLRGIQSGDANLATSDPQAFAIWAGGPRNPNMHYAQNVIGGAGHPTGGNLLAASGSNGPTAGNSVTAYLTTTDPSLEWALGVPELSGILNQAASGNWSDAKLTQALQASDYYRSHSDAVRNWQNLTGTDPAEAQREIQQMEAEIKAEMASLGFNLSDSAIAGLAAGAAMFKWTSTELHQNLLAAAAYAGLGTTGALGTGIEQVKGLFADYGIKLSDQQAQAYSMQINVGGSGSLDAIRPIAVAQAKGMFPSLAQLMDQGVTPAQVFSQYQSSASQLLGIDPSQIQLTDPKWARALDGGPNKSQLSLNDWNSTVMTDPQYMWDRSQNGRMSAYNLAQSLGQTLGVVAP